MVGIAPTGPAVLFLRMCTTTVLHRFIQRLGLIVKPEEATHTSLRLTGTEATAFSPGLTGTESIPSLLGLTGTEATPSSLTSIQRPHLFLLELKKSEAAPLFSDKENSLDTVSHQIKSD